MCFPAGKFQNKKRASQLWDASPSVDARRLVGSDTADGGCMMDLKVMTKHISYHSVK